MKRRILEKDVFYKACVYERINHISAFLIAFKRYILLNNNQGSCFGLGHIHAGIHNRKHITPHILFSIAPPGVVEQLSEKSPPLVVAERHEKAFYLVLEKNYKHQQAYAHELVENSAYELHVENLRCEHPHHDKRQYAVEYVYGSALLHYFVDIIKKEGGKSYVEYVAKSE